VKFTNIQLEDLPKIAPQIRQFAEENQRKIWVLQGEMGAGKTTLIKAIGKAFGILDRISSPTFSIINEYASDKEDIFYHFDFYRLMAQEEAVEIGCEDYFYSENYCFLEWAERIPDLLPDHYLLISIQVDEYERRSLNLVIQ